MNCTALRYLAAVAVPLQKSVFIGPLLFFIGALPPLLPQVMPFHQCAALLVRHT
jgi:hypothetical protein